MCVVSKVCLSEDVLSKFLYSLTGIFDFPRLVLVCWKFSSTHFSAYYLEAVLDYNEVLLYQTIGSSS